MKRNSAQLPVDFLVGFTIFILSLIMVANFVPSLLVGLQRTSGIDYDAVAYRTGVVLVEDPGWPAGIPIGSDPYLFSTLSDWRPWEFMADKNQVSRFGLALTRDTPNIVSINKIYRFFCTTASLGGFDDQFDSTSNDYRDKLLFSPYQYGYNITLKNISPMKPGDPLLNGSIGQPYPSGYGYIRRYVVIKQNPNATINMADPGTNSYFNAQDAAQICINLSYYQGDPSKPITRPAPLASLEGCNQQFTIRLDGSVLYNKSIDTPFKLDLQSEPLIINITGLRTLLNNSDPGYNPSPFAYDSFQWGGSGAPTWATLKAVDFGIPSASPGDNSYIQWSFTIPADTQMGIRIANDSGSWQALPLPASGIDVFDSIRFSMNYVDANYLGEAKDLDITFSFNNHPDPPYSYIHRVYQYYYNQTNVTQPYLSTGMLEVGVW